MKLHEKAVIDALTQQMVKAMNDRHDTQKKLDRLVVASRNLCNELLRGNHDARLSLPAEVDTLDDLLKALS